MILSENNIIKHTLSLGFVLIIVLFVSFGIITIKGLSNPGLTTTKFSIYNIMGTCLMSSYTDGGEEWWINGVEIPEEELLGGKAVKVANNE